MSGVSIVIVSFNAREHLERCLDAVAGGVHEVVVVDNASEDGSPALVRERFLGAADRARRRTWASAPRTTSGWTPPRASSSCCSTPTPGRWGTRSSGWRPSSPNGRAWGSSARGCRTPTALQPSVRGWPTTWRLATEYLFLRRLGRVRARSTPSTAPASTTSRSARSRSSRAPSCSSPRGLRGDGRLRPRLLHVRRGDGSLLPRRTRPAGTSSSTRRPSSCTSAAPRRAPAGATGPPSGHAAEQLRGHLRFIAKHEGPGAPSAQAASRPRSACAASSSAARRAPPSPRPRLAPLCDGGGAARRPRLARRPRAR